MRGTTQPDGSASRSTNWLVEARNKKSVTLNLRVEAGQNILKEMIKHADVLFENVTPGTLERWGLGWDEVKKINPKIIMVRVSGYGRLGRTANARAMIGSHSGSQAICTRQASRTAFRSDPLPTADYNTGTFAALATMFALYQRHAGWEGQMIDLALYEPTFRITANMMPNFFRDGEIRERIGNRNPTFSPAGTFETKDGKPGQIAAGGVASSNAWRKRWECRNWRRTNVMPSAESALHGPTSSKRCSPTG